MTKEKMASIEKVERDEYIPLLDGFYILPTRKTLKESGYKKFVVVGYKMAGNEVIWMKTLTDYADLIEIGDWQTANRNCTIEMDEYPILHFWSRGEDKFRVLFHHNTFQFVVVKGE